MSALTLMPELWMACSPGCTSEWASTSPKPSTTVSAALSALAADPVPASSVLTALLATSLNVAKSPAADNEMPSRRAVANHSCSVMQRLVSCQSCCPDIPGTTQQSHGKYLATDLVSVLYD